MDFDRSTTPPSCSAEAPSTATAMASIHMRMRERSPMFTQSDTAPMVQKWVLLPTAPKMKARMKAPPVTHGTSWDGLASKASARGYRFDAARRCLALAAELDCGYL